MFAVTAKYLKLIERFPLRPIVSREELTAALELSLELHLAYEELAEDEKGYLAILSDVIQKCEAAQTSVGTAKVSPVEMLNWLLETNNLTQSNLSAILGVSRGRASELCNGIRPLSKTHIETLSVYFKVPADVFFGTKPEGEPIPRKKPKQKRGQKLAPRRIAASVVELRRQDRKVAGKAMKATPPKKKTKKEYS
ncbi:MAG: helix-turn-helix domain-containing protein [Cyanobacteria bacterium SZAS LIN-3]|nr:helix-turn-helix domain-containing protein [Cyanobacteria bacterium SZAS LIN-3]